ncbi:hypothetical protein U1Q18_002749 [Sarracenia purpurea var. burkii]
MFLLHLLICCQLWLGTAEMFVIFLPKQWFFSFALLLLLLDYLPPVWLDRACLLGALFSLVQRLLFQRLSCCCLLSNWFAVLLLVVAAFYFGFWLPCGISPAWAWVSWPCRGKGRCWSFLKLAAVLMPCCFPMWVCCLCRWVLY